MDIRENDPRREDVAPFEVISDGNVIAGFVTYVECTDFINNIA